MEVKDLDFKEHGAGSGGKAASVYFSNGYGASVITGAMFYTSAEKPYELAVLYEGGLTYNTDLTDDVLGHLNEEEVNEYLKKIEELDENGRTR
jgi:hypothetical protein